MSWLIAVQHHISNRNNVLIQKKSFEAFILYINMRTRFKPSCAHKKLETSRPCTLATRLLAAHQPHSSLCSCAGKRKNDLFTPLCVVFPFPPAHSLQPRFLSPDWQRVTLPWQPTFGGLLPCPIFFFFFSYSKSVTHNVQAESLLGHNGDKHCCSGAERHGPVRWRDKTDEEQGRMLQYVFGKWCEKVTSICSC